MRKYHVEITRIAELDIQEVFEYILSDNHKAAIKWVGEIERQIDSLEKCPLRCAVSPETKELGKTYRHIIFGNYRTIFKIGGSKVIIMRVLHASRLLDLQMFEK